MFPRWCYRVFCYVSVPQLLTPSRRDAWVVFHYCVHEESCSKHFGTCTAGYCVRISLGQEITEVQGMQTFSVTHVHCQTLVQTSSPRQRWGGGSHCSAAVPALAIICLFFSSLFGERSSVPPCVFGLHSDASWGWTYSHIKIEYWYMPFVTQLLMYLAQGLPVFFRIVIMSSLSNSLLDLNYKYLALLSCLYLSSLVASFNEQESLTFT